MKRLFMRLIVSLVAIASVLFLVVLLYGNFLNQTAAAVTLPALNLANVADGVYEGNSRILHVAPKLRVTVVAGRITDFTVMTPVAVDFNGLLARVIKAQSLGVDGISGATVSTKAVLKAIDNALTLHP